MIYFGIVGKNIIYVLAWFQPQAEPKPPVFATQVPLSRLTTVLAWRSLW